MNRLEIRFVGCVVALGCATLSVACSEDPGESTDDLGTETGGMATGGGGTTTGGVPTGGIGAGAVPTGGIGAGAVATGGMNASGGADPTGGMPTGGMAPTGGMPTGGMESTGGATPTGGMPTGGVEETGGMGPTGGMESTGGMAPTGGMPTGGVEETGGMESTGGDPGTGGGGSDLPPTGQNSIAYTGCSMANNIGNGYGRVGGSIMWNSSGYQTGAMVVQNWTDPNSSSWQLFDQKMQSIGGRSTVKAIMLQICIFPQRATDQELHDMINAARQHVDPGTHIYMVGQPQYNAGHTCTLAGDGGAEWTDQKAQELANDPNVNENLSYLGAFYLDNDAGEVMSDSCHATTSGEDALGRQAMEFFGG